MIFNHEEFQVWAILRLGNMADSKFGLPNLKIGQIPSLDTTNKHFLTNTTSFAS